LSEIHGSGHCSPESSRSARKRAIRGSRGSTNADVNARYSPTSRYRVSNTSTAAILLDFAAD